MSPIIFLPAVFTDDTLVAQVTTAFSALVCFAVGFEMLREEAVEDTPSCLSLFRADI